MPPRPIRRDPETGAIVFQLDDGSEMLTDPSAIAGLGDLEASVRALYESHGLPAQDSRRAPAELRRGGAPPRPTLGDLNGRVARAVAPVRDDRERLGGAEEMPRPTLEDAQEYAMGYARPEGVDDRPPVDRGTGQRPRETAAPLSIRLGANEAERTQAASDARRLAGPRQVGSAGWQAGQPDPRQAMAEPVDYNAPPRTDLPLDTSVHARRQGVPFGSQPMNQADYRDGGMNRADYRATEPPMNHASWNDPPYAPQGAQQPPQQAPQQPQGPDELERLLSQGFSGWLSGNDPNPPRPYDPNDPSTFMSGGGPVGGMSEDPLMSQMPPGQQPMIAGATPPVLGSGMPGVGGGRPAAPAAPPLRSRGTVEDVTPQGDPAMDEMLALGQRTGAIPIWRAQDARDGIEAYQDAYGQISAERQQLEQERRRAMGEARNRYTRAVERVNAMQLDPAHFFSDAGRTIGATLAMAFGAIGTAVSGDPAHQANVLAQINSAVDRDIAAQSENMAHQRAGLDGELNLVELMSDEFESREAALEAAKAELLESTALQVALIGNDTDSEEARVQADALQMQIRQEAEAARANAERTQAEWMIQMEHRMAQTRRLNGQAGLDERRLRGGAGGGARNRLPADVVNQIYSGLEHGVPAANTLAARGYNPELAQLFDGAQVERVGGGAEGSGLPSGIIQRVYQGLEHNVPAANTLAAAGYDPAQYAQFFEGANAVGGTTAANANGFASALRQMEDVVAAGRQAGDIPNAGLWDVTLGQLQSSNRSAARIYTNALRHYQRMMTGLAATDAEREGIRQQMMQMSWLFEDDIGGALDMMKEDLAAIQSGNVPLSVGMVISQLPGSEIRSR